MDAVKTGEFVSLLRKKKGMTQTELAEKLNISNRTVSKWENGDGYPDITILPELAQLLDVSVDELLNGERIINEESAPQIRFEAVFTESKKDIKNAIKYFFESVSRQGNPHLVSFVAGLILYMLAKLNAFHIQYEFLLNLYKYTGIAFIVISILIMLTPAYTAFSHLRNIKSRYGEIPKSKCIFSDKIYIENGEDARGRMYYFYESITKFIISADVYDIVINKKVHLVIPKSSINPEEQSEFESFIASYAKDIYNVETRKKLTKFSKAFFIICSVVLIVAFVFSQYISNSKFFYGNLNAKAQYFTENKEVFEEGLENVYKDEDIQNDLKENGWAAYYNDDLITLDSITGVDVTQSAVYFSSEFDVRFFNGYAYYEGEGIPTPKDIDFDESELDKTEPVYIEKDGVYLIGKEKNGSLTKGDWFLVMPLEDNWYYCEYH